MISTWWMLLIVLLLAVTAWLWQRERAGRMALERSSRRQLQDVEQRLEEMAQTLDWQESALLASQECLLVVEADMRVVYANPNAQACFGALENTPSLISYTRSLPLEQLASDVFSMEMAEALERVISLREKPHRVTAIVAGERASISLTDISEVQRLSRARQDMVANLSHELRTPLTSLRLLAETLQSPTGQDPSVSSGLLDKIKDEVDSLEQMAREMLDLSAIESGRQVVRLLDTSLVSIVQQAVEDMAEQALRRQVKIEVDVDPALAILADPEQAGRAILNVLHNAVKFTDVGSSIIVKGNRQIEEGTVDLLIIDEGPGIPPYELDRIFERFFRGDRSRGAPGTGLGLAIARHIMRSHGGDIRVENRHAPERGAIFCLTFQTS